MCPLKLGVKTLALALILSTLFILPRTSFAANFLVPNPSSKNSYEILGLSLSPGETLTEADLKAARNRAVRLYHTDYIPRDLAKNEYETEFSKRTKFCQNIFEAYKKIRNSIDQPPHSQGRQTYQDEDFSVTVDNYDPSYYDTPEYKVEYEQFRKQAKAEAESWYRQRYPLAKIQGASKEDRDPYVKGRVHVTWTRDDETGEIVEPLTKIPFVWISALNKYGNIERNLFLRLEDSSIYDPETNSRYFPQLDQWIQSYEKIGSKEQTPHVKFSMQVLSPKPSQELAVAETNSSKLKKPLDRINSLSMSDPTFEIYFKDETEMATQILIGTEDWKTLMGITMQMNEEVLDGEPYLNKMYGKTFAKFFKPSISQEGRKFIKYLIDNLPQSHLGLANHFHNWNRTDRTLADALYATGSETVREILRAKGFTPSCHILLSDTSTNKTP